jgi:dipeptidyl aminopeptidase/acylaminoacyl peptidase
MSVADGTPTCLTMALDRTCVPFFSNVSPLWSADGQWITFAVEDQGDIPIYRVRADAMTAPERIITGERQVTGLSASRDGALLALAAMDPMSPAEILVCQADGTGEKPLTDLNRAWKAEVVRSRPERFRYERDGHQLDGWVMRPFGLSVIFLSRVMRHVSIATWVYILACDGKGARAPGGHGTSNSPGDHYHGSS